MISVCIATYNGEAYIAEQVDSILSQLSDEDEIVISDDHSTDRTLQILRSYNDPRIRIYTNEIDNSGLQPVQKVTRNFENALRHANGDYIFLSDQDDAWTSNKVEVMMRYLKDYDYVQCKCIFTDQNLKIDKEAIDPAPAHSNRWKSLFFIAPYKGCCAAVSRRLLDKALPFPQGLQSHDRWLGYLGSIRYKYIIIPDRLVYYRRHQGNISSYGKSNNPLSYRIKTRLHYVKCLINRCLFNR